MMGDQTQSAAVDSGTLSDQSAQPKKRKKKGLGFFKVFAWGSRGASSGVATMVLGYLTIYATNTMKMNAALVGSLLLVSKVIDGITDLFAGVFYSTLFSAVAGSIRFSVWLVISWTRRANSRVRAAA